MSLLEFIIAIISGGFAGAIVRYILDVRRSKYEYVMKLHREWWSEEFSQMRREVYKIAKDFKGDTPGTEAKNFLSHVAEGTHLEHPAGPAFFQIVFFFADINACLEKKLLNASFTYRLFGASQYFWFQRLIGEVRECQPNQTDDIRWRWETEALEKKFGRFRENDNRKKGKQLAK